MLFTPKTKAQCSGTIGDPIVNETFGAGTNPGPPLASGITTLTYWNNTACPDDEHYSITNLSSGCFSSTWVTAHDHTGDPNGYFMLVNASFTPSDFFVRPVSGLCDGTWYKFSAWIINMTAPKAGNNILPNLTFSIEKKDGALLKKFSTGDIPIQNPEKWNEYSFNFQTPTGISDVLLRITNNAPGGMGNDLGLDDITFSPLGPTTKMAVNGSSNNTITVCKKSGSTINLTSTVQTCYDSTAYQWQQSTDNDYTWNDIAGATASNYLFKVSTIGQFHYRLLLAQFGNINNSLCRAHSPEIYINVTEPDVSINKTICEGVSYLGYKKTGIYVDSFIATNGCDSLRTLNLTVIKPPPIPIDTITGITTICKNTTAQLSDLTPNGVWNSKNTTIASIDNNGLLKGLNTGKAIIRYLDSNMCGKDSALKTITVIGTALTHKDSITTLPTCIYPFSGSVFIEAKGNESPYTFNLNGSPFNVPYKVTNLSEGTYDALIYNNAGCLVDSISNIKLSLVLDITCDTLYVPSAFVSMQNELKPYGGASYIKDVSFRVYNRYGNLIFQTNSLFKGWNGQADGILQESGTYIWYLDYTFTNNQQKHTKGTSVMLR